MSTVSIVLAALQASVQVIDLAEPFVTNANVKKILGEVRTGIEVAITALQPHHAAEAEAARGG